MSEKDPRLVQSLPSSCFCRRYDIHDIHGPSDSFNQYQISFRRFHADLLRKLVFLRVVPLARTGGAFEFEDDQALRTPAAFEHVDLAAANDELAAVLGQSRADQLAVFLIRDGIVDFDFGNDVGRQGALPGSGFWKEQE